MTRYLIRLIHFQNFLSKIPETGRQISLYERLEFLVVSMTNLPRAKVWFLKENLIVIPWVLALPRFTWYFRRWCSSFVCFTGLRNVNIFTNSFTSMCHCRGSFVKACGDTIVMLTFFDELRRIFCKVCGINDDVSNSDIGNFAYFTPKISLIFCYKINVQSFRCQRLCFINY